MQRGKNVLNICMRNENSVVSDCLGNRFEPLYRLTLTCHYTWQRIRDINGKGKGKGKRGFV